MKGSQFLRSFSFFFPSLSYVLLLLLLQSTCHAQPDTPPPSKEEEFIVSDAAMNLRKQLRYTVCTDLREACAEWAHNDNDECRTNPAYMGPHCPVSCHTCSLLQPRTTDQPFGPVLPQRVHASSGWEFPDAVGRDLGVPQIMYDRELSDQIRARIQQARSVERDETCRNHNINCTTWAVEGECETNPDYMHQYCAPVCGVCERTT